LPHAVACSRESLGYNGQAPKTEADEIESGHAPSVASAPVGATVRLPSFDEIVEHWSVIAPHLRKATVRTGCYEPIDLLQLALAGQVGIWTCEVGGNIVAAIATTVKQYPRKRILEILFCGGSQMREWIDVAVQKIDAHAHQCGCSHVSGIGRISWGRVWGGKVTDYVIVRGLGELHV